ncbi:acylneuraminate cytidylyltransferase family protein [Algoriphagus lutimaris]|uniref:acylneuraminate cytidylyltransferase family protein n=1 Tax=Algoriphagus lutimaris TaxID=613197 RepID=UPI00196AA2C2|nr:acylneuraminate cytidylyltransferase family protein [Algoriphagus lutimaris]MBN3518671.1 acylneuraminate cytidylyltransferase family protein [Algoriphagus lutimaris]
MKPLVVIPARGGSKGVPRKNIKLLGGKPLIQYTIDAARKVFPDEVICVSTDDEEIREIVKSLGLQVPFLRPAELATDNTGTHEVLLHAVDFYENSNYQPDVLILLQPTSPFRTDAHIKEALERFDKSCEMLVSVKETKSNPYYVLREENEAGWLVKSKEGDFIRRQDCPKVYELNGAIYIIHVDSLKLKPIQDFKKVRKYEMDELSSHDIDNIMDFSLAEMILHQKTKPQNS